MEFEKGVPKLNPTISYNGLQLTPTEGYFLSRIDGVSTVEDIASLSGLPYDKAIEVIESLWGKKVFTMEGVEPSAAQVAETLDLNEDEQSAIEKMAETVEKGTFYQILSLPVQVKPEQVKIRFFELSKTFHPDRYFRKNIGRYKDMLTTIFKKLSEAYEILYDPKKKQWYDSMLARPRTAAPPSGKASSLRTNPPAARVVRPVRVVQEQKETRPPDTGAARKDTGEKTVASGQRKDLHGPGHDDHAEQSAAADGSLQDDTAGFIPPPPDIPEQGAVQAEHATVAPDVQNGSAVSQDVEEKIGRINRYLENNMPDEALKEMNRIKDSIRDPRIPLLMAAYYLKKNDLLAAKDYAQTAVEYDETNRKAYEMLGDIYMQFKLYRNALKVYEIIMRLDPSNAVASEKVREIKSLIEE